VKGIGAGARDTKLNYGASAGIDEKGEVNIEGITLGGDWKSCIHIIRHISVSVGIAAEGKGNIEESNSRVKPAVPGFNRT